MKFFENVLRKLKEGISYIGQPATNRAAYKFAELIKNEIPLGEVRENKPKPGHLRDTVKVIESRKTSDGMYKAIVEIGNADYPYAATLLEGASGDVHNARAGGLMVFPESAWKNGNTDLLGGDGNYRFKQVNYNVPPNDYMGRAADKFMDMFESIALSQIDVILSK